MDNMERLGSLLRDLRGDTSLREAAKKLSMSHNYLSMIEKGRDIYKDIPVNPSLDMLRNFSSIYGYPYDELLKIAGYLDASTKIDYVEKGKEVAVTVLDIEQNVIGERLVGGEIVTGYDCFYMYLDAPTSVSTSNAHYLVRRQSALTPGNIGLIFANKKISVRKITSMMGKTFTVPEGNEQPAELSPNQIIGRVVRVEVEL